MVAGDQVPVNPFADVEGKTGAGLFWQRGPIAANTGVTLLVIETVKVAFNAHCPESGVKVKVVI